MVTGENHPQPPATLLPHCALQVTPSDDGSFATVTLTGTEAVLTSEVGGVCVNESVGETGEATMVVNAAAAFEGVVAAEEALIVTRPPVGTDAGAV